MKRTKDGSEGSPCSLRRKDTRYCKRTGSITRLKASANRGVSSQLIYLDEKLLISANDYFELRVTNENECAFIDLKNALFM